jgi:hypothetical protein
VSGFELVAGVIAIFFVTGLVMGVLIVAALPRWLGRRSAGRRSGRGYMNGGDWREPPRRDDDERPPRWPGG